MQGEGAKPEPNVFRPSRGFAIAMGIAGIHWVAVLLYLLHFSGVPWKTFLSTAFFIVFFALSVAYYGRTAIFVDAAGFTYRGMVRTLRFSFRDISKVHVLPGPVTVYSVRAGHMGIHFTSFFSHHRQLMELLVQKAGLARIAG
jgi:hypothetical protein